MILKQIIKKFTINALFRASIFGILTLSAYNPLSAKQILIYGDSLSAAYGMNEDSGWVTLLTQSLDGAHTVNNASISGETSAGALARLPLTLQEMSPDLIVIELGANDGLRGYSTRLLKDNLQNMIDLALESGASVVLASISLPPTYGPRYIDSFRAVYTELAAEYDIPLLDMYQPSFAEKPGYIQQDGLHPTEITQPIIRDLVVDFFTENNLLED